MKYGILILCLMLSGCVKEWQNPAESPPATKLSISSLLLTPAIYQMEGVKTTGKIWDLVYLTDEKYELKFKLADEDGYYIDIVSEKGFEIGEGDIVEVNGQFFREYVKEENEYETFIVAKNITVIRIRQ